MFLNNNNQYNMEMTIQAAGGPQTVEVDRVEFFEDCIMVHPSLERYALEDIIKIED